MHCLMPQLFYIVTVMPPSSASSVPAAVLIGQRHRAGVSMRAIRWEVGVGVALDCMPSIHGMALAALLEHLPLAPCQEVAHQHSGKVCHQAKCQEA